MTTRSDTHIEPLAKAFVSIYSSSGELLATTRTDTFGRYRFIDLPADRVSLGAAKPGFLTQRAAGRAGERVTVDCSVGCLELSADFMLALGSVVAGVVRDDSGVLLRRAAVELTAASSTTKREGTTDDLGRFRFAGLSAGEYTLTVHEPARKGGGETLSRPLKLREGQTLDKLNITLGRMEVFQVAGALSGVPNGEGHRVWVQLSPVEGGGRPLYADVGWDGSFAFESVPRGRYQAGAGATTKGTGRRNDYAFEIVDVESDMVGLALRPMALASIQGAVEIAAGTLPPGATARIVSNDGFGHRWFQPDARNGRFSLDRIRPGSYRVEPHSKGFYVRGVQRGDAMETPSEVRLESGENWLTIVLAADFSVLHGVVRDENGDATLRYARVSLQGGFAELTVRSDQNGRYEFDRVIPGEYRICAWADLGRQRLADEMVWERAGCASRVIPIDPSSEVEIDLRAAP